MKITHRVGSSPASRGSTSGANCPDVMALDTGDYLIIGKFLDDLDITAALAEHGASIGEDEAPVIVPAAVLHHAVLDIASQWLTQPLTGEPA